MSKLKSKIYTPGDPEFAAPIALISELTGAKTMKTVSPEDMADYLIGALGYADDGEGYEVVAGHAAISQITDGEALISSVVSDPFFRKKGVAKQLIGHVAIGSDEVYGDEIERYQAYVNPHLPSPFKYFGFEEVGKRDAPETGCTSIIAAPAGLVLARAAQVVPIM